VLQHLGLVILETFSCSRICNKIAERQYNSCVSVYIYIYIHIYIYGVSGGIVNILGGGGMDYSE